MKITPLILLFSLATSLPLLGQGDLSATDKVLVDLIDRYAEAREAKDTAQLRRILTDDIDQLVSSGTWRRGMEESVAGMLRSSTRNPGDRVLTVDHIRHLPNETAIVDARYEIRSPDGSVRRMWSTFIAVREDGEWKIAAIRNMLPAG
jgi:uncharacterized protein (TIGR02246 family)